MSFPVIKCSYRAEDIEIDPHEVLRYLGYKKELVTAEDIAQVQALLPEARAAIKAAACWGRFEVELLEEGKIRFPYGQVVSRDLWRNLTLGVLAGESSACGGQGALTNGSQPCGSREVFLFAATIGLAYDRLVQRARITSMAKASFLNAIGAAAVENVCDQLNEELCRIAAKEGKSLRPRYSAGYGDFSLENQRGIFDLLSPAKHIGLTLKDNLIMVPEKSVTAVIGLY